MLELRRLACAVEESLDPDSRESDQTVVGGGEAAGGAEPGRAKGIKAMGVECHARLTNVVWYRLNFGSSSKHAARWCGKMARFGRVQNGDG